MAKGNYAKKSAGFQPVEFVNVPWTRETDEAFDQWVKGDAPPCEEAIQWLTMEGYKLSLKYDPDDSSFSCTAIQGDETHPFSGYALSGWDDNAEGSILVTLYKLSVLLRDTDPKSLKKPTTGRR